MAPSERRRARWRSRSISGAFIPGARRLRSRRPTEALTLPAVDRTPTAVGLSERERPLPMGAPLCTRPRRRSASTRRRGTRPRRRSASTRRRGTRPRRRRASNRRRSARPRRRRAPTRRRSARPRRRRASTRRRSARPRRPSAPTRRRSARPRRRSAPTAGAARDRVGPARRPAGAARDRVGPARRPAGAARDLVGVARRPAGAARDRVGPARRPTGVARDRVGPARRPAGAARDRVGPARRPAGAARDRVGPARRPAGAARDLVGPARRPAGPLGTAAPCPLRLAGVSKDSRGRRGEVTPRVAQGVGCVEPFGVDRVEEQTGKRAGERDLSGEDVHLVAHLEGASHEVSWPLALQRETRLCARLFESCAPARDARPISRAVRDGSKLARQATLGGS